MELTKLSDIIDHHNSSRSHWREDGDKKENECLVFLSGTNGQSKFSISYNQTHAALKQHRQWMSSVLHAFSPSESDNLATSESRREPNNQIGNQSLSAETTSTTVVAYIANNSADFFLSVLAATDLSTVVAKQARQQCTPPLGAIYSCLLNTRWTVDEMVYVLKPKTTGKGIHKTIILYGPTFRTSAVNLAKALMVRGNLHDQACFKPIPEYAMMMRNKLQVLLHRGFATQVKSFSKSRSNDDVEADNVQNISQLSHSRATAMVSDDLDDTALILFTSGTTSGAKGVKLGHGALLTQILAKTKAPCWFSSNSRVLASSLPFYHVGGLVNILAVWLAGGTLVLREYSATQPIASHGASFDPYFVWSTMSHDPVNSSCNTLVVVPAMIHMLQQTSPCSQFPHVRLILVGGQSCAPSALDFLRQIFPHARIIQTYACTEAASSLAYHDVTKHDGSTSSTTTGLVSGDCVGKPPAHVEIALFPMEERDDVSATKDLGMPVNEPFQVGLIATRGPHLMIGYWERGACPTTASSSYKRPNNWFVTNDLGAWDSAGNLYFCGRASDTIRTGGETVLALEVERKLQQHPLVKEVAVFPIPDVQYGETVACAIVLATTTAIPNHDSTKPLTLHQLRIWCKESGLAGYKCPRYAIFLSSLPRNQFGKVLKAKLKQHATAGIPIRSHM
ncbi:hypothetical protein ACA910_007767 [Epithemia clementina (nom. ined.)]